MLKAVSKHFQQRRIFDSIIFLDIKPVNSFNDLLVVLFDKIAQSMTVPPLLFMDKMRDVSTKGIPKNKLKRQIQSML